MTGHLTVARLSASMLAYDDLPDYEVFTQAAWAVQDTVERVADEPLYPEVADDV